MRKYRLVAKKGEGTFSEVLKAQNVKDGKYHAIKCMKSRFDTIEEVRHRDNFIYYYSYTRKVSFMIYLHSIANFHAFCKCQVNNLREIQALRRLSPHEHVITLEEVLYDQPTGRLALVFELMDANLYELIRGNKYFHSLRLNNV